MHQLATTQIKTELKEVIHFFDVILRQRQQYQRMSGSQRYAVAISLAQSAVLSEQLGQLEHVLQGTKIDVDSIRTVIRRTLMA
ncbi:MAG: hypothetical protein F6K11_34485 [Leptolyngbya sp. SIO3F4]|nr:hypothetical protein [Leptolyngbya sp. SIO3F4]